MSSEFYASAPAVAMYHDYVRAVVGRRNSITGLLYRDDPAIMAWQLANEPRPGGSPGTAASTCPPISRGSTRTARLIKSLDPNHLVSTGSEGTQGCIDDDQCVVNAHASPAVDYMTAHIWPQNWSWADPKDLPGTWPTTEANTRAYFARQVADASALGKPLVIEEFGFPRDGGSFDAGHADDLQGPLLRPDLRARVEEHARRRTGAGLQFLGLGRRRPGAARRPPFRSRRHQLRRRPAARAAGLVQRLRHRRDRPRRSSAAMRRQSRRSPDSRSEQRRASPSLWLKPSAPRPSSEPARRSGCHRTPVQ